MCAGEIFNTQQYFKKSTNPLYGNFQIGLRFFVLTKDEGVARKLQTKNIFSFVVQFIWCILIEMAILYDSNSKHTKN